MENLDFEEFLQNETKDDINKKLIFLDPPYFLEKNQHCMVTMVIYMNILIMKNY